MDFKFGQKELKYAELAKQHQTNSFVDLCRVKKIPVKGWTESQLIAFMEWVAIQDSNNQTRYQIIGAGEREGRVACNLVKTLHFSCSHGIGRSGSLLASQPKAQGSTLINMLANEFALESIQLLGLEAGKGALIVPLCTGMSISLALSALRLEYMDKNTTLDVPKYVIWLRADQMSCPKGILHAGFIPLVVDPITSEESSFVLITNISYLESLLKDNKKIFAVVSCTECFSPREPDLIEEISILCKDYDVYHIINNAYGLTVREHSRQIMAGKKNGRIDCIIQSLDKNYQVPVGGAIIVTVKKSQIDKFAKAYPGRASMIPSRDFVLTILNQGKDGLLRDQVDREELFKKSKELLREKIALKYNERVLDTKNCVSMAMTLSNFSPQKQTLIGSMLFHRGVTGARVIQSTSIPSVKKFNGIELENYFSHSKYASHSGYLNIAIGIGMKEEELNGLLLILDNVLQKI